MEWRGPKERKKMGRRLLTLVAERRKFRDIARKMNAPEEIVNEGNINSLKIFENQDVIPSTRIYFRIKPQAPRKV